MAHSLWFKIAVYSGFSAIVVGSAIQGFRDGYRKRVNLSVALPVAVLCVPVGCCVLYAWTRDELLPAVLAGLQLLWAVTAVTGQYCALRKGRGEGGASS